MVTSMVVVGDDRADRPGVAHFCGDSESIEQEWHGNDEATPDAQGGDFASGGSGICGVTPYPKQLPGLGNSARKTPRQLIESHCSRRSFTYG